MSVRPVTLALAAALALPTALLADAPADAPAKGSLAVVTCGHAVDTAAGKLLGETSVVVEDGRIKEVRAGQLDKRRRSEPP